MLDADGPHELFHIDKRGRIPLSRKARAGVVLMTGHTGDAVVENDIDGIRPVINRVHQRIDARVEEGRISDNGDDSPACIAHIEGALRPVAERDARPHAAGRIQRLIRLSGRQRIAADIAGDHNVLPFAEAEEEAGYKSVWMPVNEALELFGKYESFRSWNIPDYGLYRREYIALKEYADRA